MKIRLPWKLTFVFCSAIVFALVIGYFYLTFHMKKYVEGNLENTLRYRLLSGRDLVQSRLTDRTMLAMADPLADRIGTQQDVRVTLMGVDGTVLGDSDLNAQEVVRVENHLGRPEVQDALRQGLGVSKRYSYTIKKYLLYMAMPFGQGQALSGVIRYAIPISYLEMLEGKFKQLILGALGLVFLLSLAFTFVISTVVSKPLDDMASVARAMAQGDFSRKPLLYSRDEIGDLARALSYMSDEIKSKIDKISREGVKLDAVLSSMFEGVMVVDENGGILLMNPSLRKLFFVDFEPEKKSPVEVLRNPQIQNMVDKIIKEGRELMSEEIMVTQPEEKTLKINAAPIVRDGVLEGAVLVFHNITELRKLERVRQDFVANVSHELRTPVSSIKGYAETLLEGAIDDKDNMKDFLNIIYQDSTRLASLIDDLLDLAKIESGKMNMVFTPLGIEPILTRCLGVLGKLIKDKHLAVTINIPEGLPKVTADDKRLTQVFLNLLDNAVKYTPEQGVVKVDVSFNDQFVQVDISDTGIGIPEKDLSRIFERFYRVDKARSREVGGTGLGLSIVKHIILSHGGQVWVKSMIDQGSTFSFTVPRA